MPSLVWFGQLLDSMKKTYFKKFLFREIQKVPYEKLIFSLAAKPKIFFVLHSNYTGDTPYQIWFDLNSFLAR